VTDDSAADVTRAAPIKVTILRLSTSAALAEPLKNRFILSPDLLLCLYFELLRS